MPFTFRQFYISPISSPEHVSSLCAITAECDALEADGWQMQTQIALPGGREVLFTFKREASAKVSEDDRKNLHRSIFSDLEKTMDISEETHEEFEDRILYGTGEGLPPEMGLIPIAKRGRPRKVETTDGT